MLRNRSALPSGRERQVVADEVGIPDDHQAAFGAGAGASSSAVDPSLPLPLSTCTAAARVSGPARSSSPGLSSPLSSSSALRSPQLASEVITSSEMRTPSGPVVWFGGDEALGQRKDRPRVLEAAGDRMEPVGGGERSRHSIAEELADAARVDDHIPGGGAPRTLRRDREAASSGPVNPAAAVGRRAASTRLRCGHAPGAPLPQLRAGRAGGFARTTAAASSGTATAPSATVSSSPSSATS